MAVAALEQITSWGVARIAAALARTTAVIAQGSEQLGFASPPADQRGPHILASAFPKIYAAAWCPRSPRPIALRPSAEDPSGSPPTCKTMTATSKS